MAQSGGLTIVITGDATGIDAALQHAVQAISGRMADIERRLGAGEQATKQFSDRAAKHIQTIERSMDSLTKHVDALGSALVSLSAAFQTSGALAGFLQDVALTAARTETLQVVLMKVAQNAGVTALQAGVARDRIKALGVTTQEASVITARFIQANLGLENAIKLANVARNAAVIADQNTSQALAGLVQGILTLQQETLRTYGIFVNLSQANDAYAKSIGKTAEQLTVYEKQQVALNATLQQGVHIEGTYEAALDTVGKKITSLNRVIEESKNVMGNNYLPVVNSLIDGVTRLLTGFQTLPPWVQTATAAIVGAAAAVGTFTVAVTALVRIGQVLAVGALFTGWGPVILAIGAATAAAITLTKVLRGVSETDPATVLQQSTAAIEDRIRSTQHLLSAQTSSLQKMQEQLKTTPESKAGAEIIAQQTLRVQQLQNALDALRVTRDQLAKPIVLPPPKPAPPEPPDPEKGLQAAANAAKAEEAIIEQSLKRQEALIAQSFDARRQQAEEFFAEQVRQAPGEAQQIQEARAGVFRQIAQEEATLFESARLVSNDKMLAATIDHLQKEKAAHAGKVADLAKIEGQVTEAYAEHSTQREVILKKTGDVRTRIAKEATDAEIKELIRANDILEKTREQGLEDFAKQTRAIEQRVEREQQQIQESQLRSYENFVGRVAGMLNDIFTGLLEGTLNAVDFFKKLLIAQLANIASSVIAPFVAGLAASVATALGSALPGSLGQLVTQGVFGPAGAPQGGLSGLLGMGGKAVMGLGLTEKAMEALGLPSLTNSVTLGFTGLKESMLAGIDSVFGTSMAAATQAASVNAALATETALGIDTAGLGATGTAGTVSRTAAAAGTSTLGMIGGVAGGLTALAGGIYGALNATNTASKAAYAASAAAGTAALASVALTSAGVIAASAGWTGIGLIAAAVTAIVGTVAELLIKPEGPTLAVGRPSGLGIGVQGGQLAVAGDLGSQVLRRDKVDPGMARGVQAQLEEGLTNAVISIVQTINAVALDPAALLGPTQDALQRALQNMQPINSANAKKMEQDITEQLRFVSTQIVAGMLGPLNRAFDQLRDQGDLAEQLDRLPATTAGLAEVFKTMNTRLSEIAGSQNTDVLRQLSGVRSQVEQFGARVADTAGMVAESIVDQLITVMQTTVVPTLTGQITQFSGLMDASLRALTALRTTQQTLEGAGLSSGGVSGQLNRLVQETAMVAGRISTEIVTTAMRGLSDDLQTVLVQPLRVQATTVSTLFNDAMAALQSLGTEWARLGAVGIDTTAIQEQHTRLVGSILETVGDTLTSAFKTGGFAEFLAVAASIPQAVTALNPAWQQLQQMAAAFAQALAPTLEGIRSLEDQMRTTGERSTFAADRVAELRSAIADAGTAADQALPLYQQLGQAVLAQAAAEEAAIRETFARAAEAMQALNTVIETQTSLIAELRGEQEALQQSIEGIISDQDRLISDLTGQQQDIIRGYEELNDSLTRALMELRAEVSGLQEDIAQTLRGQASPVRAAEMIRTELMRLQGVAAGQTGAEQLATLKQQKALLDELLALGQRTDQLGVMAEARVGLEALATQLAAIGSSLDAQATANEAQLIAAKADRDAQLAILNAQLAEAQATRTAAQAQLDWIIAQTGLTAQTPAAILATAQQTWSLLQTQIAQAEADRAVATAQLQQMAGTTDLQAAQTALTARMDTALQSLRENTLTQLRAIEGALREVFAAQPLAQNLLHLETQTSLQQQLVTSAGSSLQFLAGIFNLLGALNTVVEKSDVIIQALNRPLRTVAAQHGGMIMAMARGGLVPALLEPGERIFTPPMSHAQRGALMGMNTAFPRFAGGGFTVPGSGLGDSVFAMVPSGSFVMNKRASGAMGYQGGGAVSGRRAPADQRPIVINIYQTQGQSTRELIAEISRQLRREFRSQNDSSPWS